MSFEHQVQESKGKNAGIGEESRVELRRFRLKGSCWENSKSERQVQLRAKYHFKLGRSKQQPRHSHDMLGHRERQLGYGNV